MFIRWFDDLTAGDVAVVGGKNASLGEMIRALKAGAIREAYRELSQRYQTQEVAEVTIAWTR